VKGLEPVNTALGLDVLLSSFIFTS
jgi:hypothetical protein